MCSDTCQVNVAACCWVYCTFPLSQLQRKEASVWSGLKPADGAAPPSGWCLPQRQMVRGAYCVQSSVRHMREKTEVFKMFPSILRYCSSCFQTWPSVCLFLQRWGRPPTCPSRCTVTVWTPPCLIDHTKMYWVLQTRAWDRRRKDPGTSSPKRRRLPVGYRGKFSSPPPIWM